MKHYNIHILEKMRDKSRIAVASGPVILDFEKEGDLSAERLRELFLQEIRFYHNPDNKWKGDWESITIYMNSKKFLFTMLVLL